MLFSTLVPALSFSATVRLPTPIGTVATGSNSIYVDVVTGTLTSEPEFSPKIQATAIRGGDHITTDPPNPHSNATVLRLHLDTLVQTQDEPAEYIRMRATGVEIATPEAAAILSGDRNAAPVAFGDFQAVSSWAFETGSAKYWELQNAVFVGTTSLAPGKEEGTIVVGFKIAKVVSSKGI
ncbi:uncharacterized protein yc1106_00339 [Curvularia clavata]|uniref:Uncharacterized protein n=1 Tax=Curvularia clavata TaxID=95742 RepID=A0A9Q8Z064_CURCL|nr:uncharacterized protein yc1106_00339 [Curvularia clavata]